METEKEIREEFEQKIREDLEEKIDKISIGIKKDMERGKIVERFCLQYLTRCKEKYVELTGRNYDPSGIDRYTLPAYNHTGNILGNPNNL